MSSLLALYSRTQRTGATTAAGTFGSGTSSNCSGLGDATAFTSRNRSVNATSTGSGREPSEVRGVVVDLLLHTNTTESSPSSLCDGVLTLWHYCLYSSRANRSASYNVNSSRSSNASASDTSNAVLAGVDILVYRRRTDHNNDSNGSLVYSLVSEAVTSLEPVVMISMPGASANASATNSDTSNSMEFICGTVSPGNVNLTVKQGDLLAVHISANSTVTPLVRANADEMSSSSKSPNSTGGAAMPGHSLFLLPWTEGSTSGNSTTDYYDSIYDLPQEIEVGNAGIGRGLEDVELHIYAGTQ